MYAGCIACWPWWVPFSMPTRQTDGQTDRWMEVRPLQYAFCETRTTINWYINIIKAWVKLISRPFSGIISWFQLQNIFTISIYRAFLSQSESAVTETTTDRVCCRRWWCWAETASCSQRWRRRLEDQQTWEDLAHAERECELHAPCMALR